MRVLVLWADSRSANLGVQVLAHGMADLARMAWGSTTQVDFQDYGAGDSSIGFGNRAMLKDLGRRDGLLKQKLRDYDIIIDSGAGDSFADIYGFQRLMWMANANRLANKLGVPVVLGPQTIGPFEKFWGRFMGKYVLNRATQIHVRDSESLAYLRRMLPRAAATLGTDVVFALPQPTVARQTDVLFNVSGLLWQKNPHVDNHSYRAVVRGSIERLQECGRKVTLLSHVIENPNEDNDVPVCRGLGEEIGTDLLVPRDVFEARDMVASAGLVIGSRMHACLNALSVGTPSLPLAYSRKFAPLMADIGWTHVQDLRAKETTSKSIVAEALGLLEGRYSQELRDLESAVKKRMSASVTALRSAVVD